MSLEQNIMAEMKEAMKSKNEAVLRGLRAIKAEIIKAKTEPGAHGEIDEATEQKFLQKMMKQRRDSLEIFEQQGRADLAEKEKEEMAVIEKFLPKQLGEAEIKEAVAKIIADTGASSPADMGKVMGVASKQLAGQADGKNHQRHCKRTACPITYGQPVKTTHVYRHHLRGDSCARLFQRYTERAHHCCLFTYRIYCWPGSRTEVVYRSGRLAGQQYQHIRQMAAFHRFYRRIFCGGAARTPRRTID